MAKYDLRPMAKELRSQGESIKFIASQLRISASTASHWCRDIELTPLQLAALERRAHDPRYGKRLENSLKQKEIRETKTKNLLNEGIDAVGKISDRELLIAGIALYWAEGFKKDNLVGFSNSDPGMIVFFIRWLKVCFGYQDSDLNLRIVINQSHQSRIEQIENYWSEITGIPRSQFRRPTIQKVIWRKIYDNPEDYHGVLRIRVKKSTDFLRKIRGYIEGLKQQAN
jgi:hypothetical protein